MLGIANVATKCIKYNITRRNISNPHFPKLFEPLRLSDSIVLQNRVIMGSMHTGLEEENHSEMAAFYEERARGGVGLIVTGGIAPNKAGRAYFGASVLSSENEAGNHTIITETVHKYGSKIALQILHTGSYAFHYFPVSASAVKSPIGWSTPKSLSHKEIIQTIDDYVKCAIYAQQAGYDGVEVMGSEGYFINQFIALRTNKRTDDWGGSYTNRIKLPIEIVKRIRATCGPNFIIIYRLSMLDLVEGGSSWEEIVTLAQAIEASGASIINTGIGWHEARVPTIATMVPRGAFTWVTKKLKNQISIPLCTTNRINSPTVAEDILSHGSADLVSMARPFLADPNILMKSKEGRVDEINTCIACNQACLDHTFNMKRASCLVNPRAGYEAVFNITPVRQQDKLQVAVIGAGPAGLAAATTAASRGHIVTLYEAESKIGGQFNMAKLIPGKEEFYETLRYFKKQLQLTNVNVQLNTTATIDMLKAYDAIIVCTGVKPRKIDLPNKSNGKVNCYSYVDVLKYDAKIGDKIAILGAGGIGFDVADYISHPPHPSGSHKQEGPPPVVDEVIVSDFLKTWNIDTEITSGGLKPRVKKTPPSSVPELSAEKISSSTSSAVTSTHNVHVHKKIYLLQRKKGKLGATLGRTTGWIHRTTIKQRGVEEMNNCKYIEINEHGLVIERDGKQTILDVDTVILCTGQVSKKDLYEPLKVLGKKVFLVGGSQEASELDAKRAIDQGTRLAAVLETANTGDVYNAPVTWQHRIMKYMKMI